MLSGMVTPVTPAANPQYCTCDDPQCEDPYKAVGCFKDKKFVHMEKRLFDYDDSQESDCCDMLCKCSKKAKSEGFTHFGIRKRSEYK